MNDNRQTALLISEDADKYRPLLAPLPQGWQMACVKSTEEVSQALLAAEVLIGDPDLVELLLPQMPGLRWIQSTWAGVTPLVKALGAWPHRTPVPQLTNIRGIFGPLMAEYVFAYLLSHERQLWQRWQGQLQRRWQGTPGGTLQGKTLGLLGLGSIGAHLARCAEMFGMTCWGCTRTPPTPDLVQQHFFPDQLAEMVAGVDYLVCTLPSTPATQDLVDAELLSHFQPHALLINAGRGDLIVDQALVEALNQGRLAGAVLDVFREEPLPPEHPFWETPNLIITSHTAAPSLPHQVAPILLDNLRRYAAGQALLYPVDLQRGY